MNIEAQINQKFWNEIEASYKKENYSHTIMQAIIYLIGLLKQNSGIKEENEDRLINTVLNAQDPKIKIISDDSKFSEQTKRNIQEGFHLIIRGIWKAFRNPRSHEINSSFEDKKENTDIIILFLDYLINQIDKGEYFNLETFIENRILDKHFSESEKNAKIIVSKIPNDDILLDLFLSIYDKRQLGYDKFTFLLKEIYEKLKLNQEDDVIIRIICKKLETEDDEKTIGLIIKIFHEYWEKFDEAIKIRIENMINKAINNFQYDQFEDEDEDIRKDEIDHYFTSYSYLIFEHYSLKNELLNIITNILKNPKAQDQKDYIYEYIFNHLPKLENKQLSKDLVHVINDLLDNDDEKVYIALNNLLKNIKLLNYNKKWFKPFQEAYDKNRNDI